MVNGRLWFVLALPLFLCRFQGYSEGEETFSWADADRVFNAYCYECHGGYATDADLDLINVDQQADTAANPERWAKVVQALRTHYMPHPDGKDMPPAARKKLISRIQLELTSLTMDYDPASASLRRLNRAEFSNTLNDLFLTEGNWAASLPADDAGYGFDNIAAALSFSPLLIERYFDVAAQIALIAVPQKLPENDWALSAGNFSGGSSRGQSIGIVSSGARNAARHRIFFPGNGSYDLSLELSAQQAGPEEARAQLWIDGEQVAEHEVTAGEGDIPELLTQTILIRKPGEHEVEVRFSNDYYHKDESGTEDRNLIFHGIRLRGPKQSAEDLRSPFLDRHFGSLPERLSMEQISNGIHRFASRAYRRPATVEEANALWSVFQANSYGPEGEWDVRNGLYAVIDAVLTSPSFLFRFERELGSVREDSFALASWLSYFLWSSMPDDRLYDQAHSGQLHTNLESEVQRMLADPKAVALAENFAGQWWRFRDLDIHRPDTAVYETANKQLLAAMREETRRFFIYVLENDRSLLDFLSADYTFVNEQLATHYGLPNVKGREFRKVSLVDTPRRGVWTQGGILTVTSYPNHTSPVLRGQWILENLIGLSPPPPPDNIPSLPNTSGNPIPGDLRASLEQHRQNSDCASCHDIMDPFGLTLEHFDGVGALRTVAERRELSEETLFDGTVIRGPVDLARYLEEQRREDFVRNVARKLSIYASGRGLDWKDEATLQRITDYASERNFRFSALVQGVVNEFAPIPIPVSLVVK